MFNPVSLGHWQPVLTRQPPGVRAVALTFDDGPTPHTTPHILDMLAAADGKATFFLSGVRIAAYPELVRAIVAAGHAVYGHAWEHDNLVGRPAAHILAVMRQAEAALVAYRPTPSPYLIRLPYNAGYNSVRVHRVVRQFDPLAQIALYSHPTYDYRLAEECADLATLAARCRACAHRLTADPTLAGGVVLLHEAPFDVASPLAPHIITTLLPAILNGLRARGLPLGVLHPHPRPARLERFLMRHRIGRTPAMPYWASELPAVGATVQSIRLIRAIRLLRGVKLIQP